MASDQDNAASSPFALTGDPLAAPASFTRFVLPFAYRRGDVHHPHNAGNPHFARAGRGDWLHPARTGSTHPVDDERFLDLARSRYLTHETSNMLFERAAWFVLCETGGCRLGWQFLDLPSSDPPRGSFRVIIRPPALVLFEWEDGVDDPKGDVLQTGLLILEAFFAKPGKDRCAPTLADVLQFNELFRFWRRPFLGHDGRDNWGFPKIPMLDAIISQWRSPGANSERDARGDADEEEHRRYTGRWATLLRLPILNGGAESCTERLSFPCADEGGIPAHPAWAVNADERAHVVACLLVDENRCDDGESAHVDEPANSPIGPLRKWARHGELPEDIGFWVQLLNADKSGGHVATRFEREWIAERTYTRWLHYGTAYGFTDHSMAMLGTSCTEPPTWRHFGQMYFDQLMLMLYVRSSIFRFSRRLSEISIRGRFAESNRLKTFEKAAEQNAVREEFSKLRREFDWFTNLYRFPLLSTQQQAIEMFNKLSKGLDIEEIYREVENEVDGTHDVLELEAAQRFALVATVLGVLSVFGLLAGVVQAALAFNWFFGDAKDSNRWWIGGPTIVAAAAVVILAGCAFCWSHKIAVVLSWIDNIRRRKTTCCRDKKRP